MQRTLKDKKRREDEPGGQRHEVLDEAGRVSGRQPFALVRGLEEAAPPQTQTLRETPADETGRGPAGLGEPPGGRWRQGERGGRGF